jgi:hypothetical protein
VEELIIIVLGGAIIYLWNRTSDIQRQIEWLRGLIDAAPAKSVRSAVEPVVMTTPATRIAPLAAPDEQTVSSEIPRVAEPNPQVETRTKLEPEPVEPRHQFALPKILLYFEDLFGRRRPFWVR